ncbi:ste11-like protein [Mycena floridula]|nr:ste11-like protein [Mycena floridula]
MAAVTANGNFHLHDNASQAGSNPVTPASPTATFQHQQTANRSYVTNIRGQSSPFPTTPTSSHINGFFDPPPGVTYAEFIRRWTDSHVARWLSEIKCGNHAGTFKANDIRGDILLELDQTTLQEMGVSSIGDRLRILNAVKSLRQKSTRASSAPATESSRPSRIISDISNDPVATNDTVPTSRLTTRRLESGRPAPLTLDANSRNDRDLPRLVREQAPDSARLSTIQNFNNQNSNNQNSNIRPLPLPQQSGPTRAYSTDSLQAAASQRTNLPPLPPPPRGQPPLPPPGRAPARTLNNGRRTPTLGADPAPAYTTLPLPAAPPNQNLLTPSAGWYGLPSDPRPGNNAKSPQIPARSISPLPPTPSRARNTANVAHGRNSSLGQNSPSTSSPSKRLGSTSSHPYANAQTAALQPPVGAGAANLSPILENFNNSQGGSTSGTPSPPSYAVGRGPYNPATPSHSNAPSLDDLRRKLVKFFLPDESLTFTIDIDTCAGGVEVIEKVLKKFDKGATRNTDAGDYVRIEDGGLSVDGWSVFLEESPNQPLDEAEILSVCYAPLDHPARERPLILRRTSKGSRRYEGSSSPLHNKLAFPTSKSTKRASALSILSDLGVHNPETALEIPSPTTGRKSPASGRESPGVKRPSKLRNFFGQRPPSELITTHLTEYFPFTEKKVLQRTARHSMLRTHSISMTRRDSVASWNPPPASRFSSSTQGSQSRGDSSPTRTSFYSAPPVPDKGGSESSVSPIDEQDIPRVSISTEDGDSLDLDDDEQPQLLPPIPFPTESLSESMENITGGHRMSRPVSRAMSNASSRRMSYMTELRSKRDRSDTASLVTVDEITANVENRRKIDQPAAEESDGWTKVGDSEPEEDEEDDPEDSYNDEGISSEEEVTLNDGDEDDELGKVTMKKANKWIKGALIGAGSFGKVYLGMDASTGLLMAVKQVELPTGSAPNLERKKSMLTALEREIEFLQDLQHENIVQYLYSSLEDDCLNIFLEYVPGGSVTALLRSYGAFEEPLVKNFVRQILQGLCYLHDRDIIHRDIKGANILVDNKGGVKISDFGISKKVDMNLLTGQRAHRPSLQGSVFWMAPEVVKQVGHTFKADIWSVGCLVVEMLTGEHPWAQLTQMQAIFKIGSSAKPAIPSDTSTEAQEFLTLTFELDHEARPSASELLKNAWIVQKSKGGA